MSWKDKIRKEDEDEKRALIGITKEKIEQIESELDSLSVKQLEELYDALDNAFSNID